MENKIATIAELQKVPYVENKEPWVSLVNLSSMILLVP